MHFKKFIFHYHIFLVDCKVCENARARLSVCLSTYAYVCWCTPVCTHGYIYLYHTSLIQIIHILIYSYIHMHCCRSVPLSECDICCVLWTVEIVSHPAEVSRGIFNFPLCRLPVNVKLKNNINNNTESSQIKLSNKSTSHARVTDTFYCVIALWHATLLNTRYSVSYYKCWLPVGNNDMAVITIAITTIL